MSSEDFKRYQKGYNITRQLLPDGEKHQYTLTCRVCGVVANRTIGVNSTLKVGKRCLHRKAVTQAQVESIAPEEAWLRMAHRQHKVMTRPSNSKKELQISYYVFRNFLGLVTHLADSRNIKTVDPEKLGLINDGFGILANNVRIVRDTNDAWPRLGAVVRYAKDSDDW